MKKQVLLTRKGFYAWLQNQEPSDIVGKSMDNTHCPIANYLVECGDRYPVVNRVTRLGVDGRTRLPKWAQRFIEKIDRRHPIKQEGFILGYSSVEVTADDALEALALP
jgi:hypothetical protein